MRGEDGRGREKAAAARNGVASDAVAHTETPLPSLPLPTHPDTHHSRAASASLSLQVRGCAL